MGGTWHPFRRRWVQSLLASNWDAQQVAKYGGWYRSYTFDRSYALRLLETESAIIGSKPMAKLLVVGGRASASPAECAATGCEHPAEQAMTRLPKLPAAGPHE